MTTHPGIATAQDLADELSAFKRRRTIRFAMMAALNLGGAALLAAVL